jgi:pSer/pThr/pTyr-binding forkhead associated (FHA) protein
MRPAARAAPPPRRAPDRAPDRPPPPRPRDNGPAAPAPERAPAAAVAGSALPKACVTGHTPPELRLMGRISKTPFSIGRAADNDLVVQVDNRVGVSGKHASIIFDKGRYFIIDQKSTYGTTLNAQRLAPNTPTPLEEGALIGLGPKVIVRFSQQDCA